MEKTATQNNYTNKWGLWLGSRMSSRQITLLLALLVGVCTAIAAQILKQLIEFIREMLIQKDYISDYHWLYLVFPVIGIFICALIIKYIVRDDIGHGVTKILFAISRRQGHIKKHNCWSSVLASSITIGFGGSVGAESPAVLTGSAIGSTLGKAFGVDQKTLMLLIGCGASGAIAGIFKAPFAGLLFTLEVLMLDLTMASLLPLLLSCVTASILTSCFSGLDTLFTINADFVFRPEHVPATITLGIFCGLISLYFTKAMNAFENVFRRIKNMYLKFILGGCVLSVLIFLFPPLYGEGYDSIALLLNNQPTDLFNNSLFQGGGTTLILFMGLIMLCKVFATTATTGGGGCGGLFAPTLFLGCFSGFAFALVWNHFQMPGTIGASSYALLGMAGVMTAIMHAPLTSIFLIAELTGGYQMLVPLMLVTLISYLTIYTFERHSIYAMRLAQKGQLITHHKDHAILTLMTLDSVIDKYGLRVSPDEELGKLVTLFAKESGKIFAVVDGVDNLRGVIWFDHIRHIIFRQELYHTFKATQLMEEPAAIVHMGSPMTEIMQIFESTGAEALPVLDDREKFIGFVYREKIYSAYRQILVDFSEE